VVIMKQILYMKTNGLLATVLAATLLLTACDGKETPASVPTGMVRLSFTHVVGASPLMLNGPTYTNPFGESYTISKFKYYITNIEVANSTVAASEKESYHLVDQSAAASLNFNASLATGSYTSISFLLGVDSTRNVSGAQTGALDPLNDMFWTWNTGYIMAKMEGNSPVSTQPNNKVEYHIGGFKGANNVLKKIQLLMPAGKLLEVRDGKTSEIKITADFAKWWRGGTDIKIATLPVCTTPGVQARQIADNYAGMFTLTDVINN
jgi:hypothetical protein